MIRVVELAGDPAAIGFAHGRQLRAGIHQLLADLDRYVVAARSRSQGLAFRALAVATARWLHRFTLPRHRREMAALAEGAGLPLNELLLLNYFDDALNVLRPLGGRPALACSVAVLGSGPRGLVHARGLDYYFPESFTPFAREAADSLRELQTLFVVRGEGMQPFVAVGWPGYAGAATGWNEAGLSLGSLTAYLPAGLPRVMASGFLYRTILEVARSLDDVRTLLRRLGCAIGNNLVVVDGRSGDFATFELAPGQPPVELPEPARRIATNHFVSPHLAARQDGLVPEHSRRRAARLAEIAPVATLDEAEGILLDGQPLGGGAHGAISNPGTVQSVVFDHRCGELAVRDWTDGVFRRFSVPELGLTRFTL